MTREASVKVGGAWKQVKAISVKVGGAWKQVRTGSVKISGTWREFFTSEPSIVLPDAATMTQYIERTGSAYAGAQFLNDGQLQYVRGATLSWVNQTIGWMDPREAASAGLFEVQATQTAGVAYSGGMVSGTWYPLDTTRSLYYAQTSLGLKNGTFNFAIRRASDQQVLASVSGVEFTAYVVP